MNKILIAAALVGGLLVAIACTQGSTAGMVAGFLLNGAAGAALLWRWHRQQAVERAKRYRQG